MKRLIGKKNIDEAVQRNKKFWTFDLEIDENRRPVVRIKDGTPRNLFPEEVSAEVLKKLKKDAELMTKSIVSRVVITVPAYFNQAQRHGTLKAAQLAGLEVMELVNEPTAAAIAYGFDTRRKRTFNLLVFDLGGGTFDVVIVNVKNGHFEILAIGGDTQLGGRDFDNKLIEYFATLLQNEHNLNCFSNKRIQQQLLRECIELKHALSSDETAK